MSKWREAAPKLRDVVAAVDGSEQTLSSWKSAAKLKDFRPAKLAVAVANTRALSKKDMINNAALPAIAVDPETFEVTADGVQLTCAPAKIVPLARTYFLF